MILLRCADFSVVSPECLPTLQLSARRNDQIDDPVVSTQLCASSGAQGCGTACEACRLLRRVIPDLFCLEPFWR